MSPAKADRTLRRLVADLAALHRDDAAAILDALSVSERRTIEKLMQGYGTSAAIAPEPVAFDRAPLSPWLVRYIDAPKAKDVTSFAHEALAACAIDVFPHPSGKVLRRKADTP